MSRNSTAVGPSREIQQKLGVSENHVRNCWLSVYRCLCNNVILLMQTFWHCVIIGILFDTIKLPTYDFIVSCIVLSFTSVVASALNNWPRSHSFWPWPWPHCSGVVFCLGCLASFSIAVGYYLFISQENPPYKSSAICLGNIRESHCTVELSPCTVA